MQGNRRTYSDRSNPRDLSVALGKLPPQACDLEADVLGAILLEKKALISVLEFLKPDHFYEDRHKIIFQAAVDLFKASQPVDMRTMVNQLRKTGKLELVGGVTFIPELTARVSSAANVEAHARIVVEMALKRKLIEISSDMQARAYDDTADVWDMIEKAQGLIFDLDSNVQRSVMNMRALYDATVAGLVEKSKTEGVTGIPSGFHQLDKITNGWQRSDLIIIAARPGMGKALALSEKILTYDGWVTMGEIKKGMLVAGSDGNFYPVTGVYPQGIRKVYNITFDDHSIVKCDMEHLWEIQSRKDRKNKRPYRVASLEQIIQESIILSGGRKNFSIKTIQPIKREKRSHYIHPYILGVLIAEGSLTKSGVLFHNPEIDISEKVQMLLPAGLTIRHKSILDKTIVRDKIKCKKNPIRTELIRLGLIGTHSFERFIPKEYMLSDVESRLELMRGLMDCDGSVIKKFRGIEYSTSSEKLAFDLIELVGSLGGKVTMKSRMGRYKSKGIVKETRLNYRLIVTFPKEIQPVSSMKSLLRYKPRRFFKKFITDVSYAGEELAQCISVASPDNLFVTNNYTLTHNTGFMLCTARHASYNHPVAIFSLEMSAQQLGERMVSADQEIENDKMRSGMLADHEWTRLNNDTTKLKDAPIFIDDTPALSVLEFRAKCRRLKAEQNIQLVIVDYLQLMSGDQGGNREQEIGSISRALKGVAKELNVPVIALSQLSRSVETRGGDKRPKLSDLRESGSIEQDADLVMFLYRPEYYKIMVDEDGLPTEGICEADVSKHRGGGTGMVKIRFKKYFTKFVNLEGDGPAPRQLKSFHDPHELKIEFEPEKPTDDLPF